KNLIVSRAVDIALGPARDKSAESSASLVVRPFLKYQVIAVTAPDDPLAGVTATTALLREQQWLLGPSAGIVDGEIAAMLHDLSIPESRQRIFQSDAAALEEVRRVGGMTLLVCFPVAKHLSAAQLFQ